MLAFGPIIHQAPLQVYSSALIFAPQNSIIRLSFENQIPEWISLKPKVPLNWSANMQTLEGHRSSIYHVVFSPNSKLVASASWDNDIKIWAADSGALLQTLEAAGQAIKSFAFFHDGGILGSVSNDGAIRLWDVNTGAILQTRDIQVKTISAAFSTDSKLLVTASGDKLVRIWVTGTGALRRTLGSLRGKVKSVAFSSDANLVAGADDHKVWVWKTDTGTLLRIITVFTGVNSGNSFAKAVSFSPNSKLLACVWRDWINANVQIWDIRTGGLLHTLDYNGDSNSVAFSPDSKLIASASKNGSIKIWAADTGVMRQVLEGHRKNIHSIAFSPDGKLVASGSDDMTLRLWDANIDAPVERRYDNSIHLISLSPDKKTVASVSNDYTVRLWDTYSGMLQCTLEGHSVPVVAVQFSPNGKIIASASYDGSFRLWAVDTGALRHTFKTFDGLQPVICQFTFSPDSKLVALASSSTIMLRSADTGHLLCTRGRHELDHIYSLVFSPDSKLLASVSRRSTELYFTVPILESRSNTVKSYSLAIHRTLEGPNSVMSSLVFSPDGRLLASLSTSNTIRLWATNSGILQQVLEGDGKVGHNVAFSPDSRCVASASDDKFVRLWDTGTGMLYRIIEIGFPSTRLKFLTTNKLQTDAGIITVDKPNTESVQCMTSILRSGRNSFSGFGLSLDGSWITFDGRNLIWLPSEFRPCLSQFMILHDSVVVIGCNSGSPIIMRFLADELRRCSVAN